MNKFFLHFLLLTTICLLPNSSRAQQAVALYDSVSMEIQKHFNAEDPKGIYALTSPKYQKRMNVEAFSEGTKKFFLKTGKWQSLKLKETNDEGVVYTASFENDTQIFFLQLDELGRISRFNFKPVPFDPGIKNYRVSSTNTLKSKLDSVVESLVRPYMQQGHTAGLCLAVLENNKVYYYSYGEVEKGSKKLPDPKKTIFEIGSVTKTFTSLLLAIEVVKGNMHLEDPINKYLPSYIHHLSFNDRSITLENLANHTSGFPRLPANIFLGNVDPMDPYKHYIQDSLFHFLMGYQPSITPGTEFSYSNFGAGLLGCLLARATNQSYEQLVVERISLPLKMMNTKIQLDSNDRERFAKGYNEKGKPTAPWNLATLQGSGAIRSTLNDMVRYTQAQLGKYESTLNKAILLTQQITFQDKDNTMGLGWRIEKQVNNIYWHHSGGTGGFRSFVGFDKKRNLGVVILSNTAEDVTRIGQTILNTQ
ncbi:MAG: serine hydrolase [Bacteroidota bacterium]